MLFKILNLKMLSYHVLYRHHQGPFSHFRRRQQAFHLPANICNLQRQNHHDWDEFPHRDLFSKYR
ncbi:unnamed protein product [Schistosoma curassoni]|uniref:Uncharacterized protein n=1 Tax=Schistosoma curassoni TaxID=6186 RepID=A0A183JJ26_9TREM|nr:unnamed protein product [Schistosoma curassoni]